jgi:ATPase subunit of ABC transporter with duplicated ATPase domains
MENKQGVAPGGSITGISAPYQPTYYPPTASLEDEPEVIKQWRERRDLALQEREARSEERKQEAIKAAQQNIDDFYENYNSKKEKTIAATRRDAEEFLESREDTSAGGTSWERIAKLVDLSGKGVKGGASGSEKGKFRDLLMSLRKDEKAPGATGY